MSSHAGGQSCGGREVSSPLGQVGSPGCVGREGGCHASGSRDVGSHGGSFKMSSHGDRQFIACLQKLPQHRNEKVSYLPETICIFMLDTSLCHCFYISEIVLINC